MNKHSSTTKLAFWSAQCTYQIVDLLPSFHFAGEGLRCRYHVHLAHPSEQSHAAEETNLPCTWSHQPYVFLHYTLQQSFSLHKLHSSMQLSGARHSNLQVGTHILLAAYPSVQISTVLHVCESSWRLANITSRFEPEMISLTCSLYVDALPHWAHSGREGSPSQGRGNLSRFCTDSAKWDRRSQRKRKAVALFLLVSSGCDCSVANTSPNWASIFKTPGKDCDNISLVQEKKPRKLSKKESAKRLRSGTSSALAKKA